MLHNDIAFTALHYRWYITTALQAMLHHWRHTMEKYCIISTHNWFYSFKLLNVTNLVMWVVLWMSSHHHIADPTLSLRYLCIINVLDQHKAGVSVTWSRSSPWKLISPSQWQSKSALSDTLLGTMWYGCNV